MKFNLKCFEMTGPSCFFVVGSSSSSFSSPSSASSFLDGMDGTRFEQPKQFYTLITHLKPRRYWTRLRTYMKQPAVNNTKQTLRTKTLRRRSEIRCPVGQHHHCNRSARVGMKQLAHLFEGEHQLLSWDNACSNVVHPQKQSLIVWPSHSLAKRSESLLDPWFVLCSKSCCFSVSIRSCSNS